MIYIGIDGDIAFLATAHTVSQAQAIMINVRDSSSPQYKIVSRFTSFSPSSSVLPHARKVPRPESLVSFDRFILQICITASPIIHGG